MSLVAGTNSYGSLAEADAYFSDSLKKEEWFAIGSTKRNQGLIEVTRVLEREAWDGTKEDSEQNLAFPRTGLTCNGETVTAAQSLETMKTAEFEYAIDVIAKPAILDNKDPLGLNNIKSAGAGPAKVEFFSQSKSSKFPQVVKEIISCFLGGSDTTDIFASGTDDVSSFSDPTLYDLSEGYK